MRKINLILAAAVFAAVFTGCSLEKTERIEVVETTAQAQTTTEESVTEETTTAQETAGAYESTGTEESSAEEDTTAVETTEEESKSLADMSEVEIIDAYEKLIDDYCEFMKVYRILGSSEKTQQLNTYTLYLSKISDINKAIDKIDFSKLSQKDSSYINKALVRINAKLMDAAL